MAGRPLGAGVATPMDGAVQTGAGHILWPEHIIGVQAPPVCLALHVLGSLALAGTCPAPHSALVGWSKELHWPRSCLVLRLRALEQS